MPRFITQADIERVTLATDLVALARSRGIELMRHGAGSFIGRCPFHVDSDLSAFIVTPENGLWRCMVCGLGGNPIEFVERHDGISFRHAFELLDQGGTAAFTANPKQKQSTVPRLPCPLDPDADDEALLGQVAAYYHDRLKGSAAARAYLADRGLDVDELIVRFQLGFADRTLGLRMPHRNRVEGGRLRTRLQQLGLWRESGHEHFNGCIVVPLHDEAGRVVSFCGRRLTPSLTARDVQELYSPGPRRGLFNRKALTNEEVILCQTVFDALAFHARGFFNATSLRGMEDFAEELWEGLRLVRRVKLAYGANDAGERAAQRDSDRLRAHGIEVCRISFPWGMDASQCAANDHPAVTLALRVNGAVWSEDLAPAQETGAMATGEKPPAPAMPDPPALEPRGNAWFMQIEGREYRVTGLEKASGADALKVALRLLHGGRFHLDHLDLCRDTERRRFIERASEETGLAADLLQRDLGRLLLAVEQAQEELSRPVANVPAQVMLTPEEHDAALAWLRGPDLIGRLREAFRWAGIIGEENNALMAYLAGVSRKLERPLAIIIQSASAAGKTTLMDAVLSFFPEEERVKYSAMTGQSLYYLGEKSLKHKILAVVEEAGAKKAGYALKLLQSEGELTIASTGKDPATGKMVTQEYHVEGPVMIFLATTAIELDEELQNRCLTLAVDETPEQTGRIHRVQRERRTLAGLIAREARRDALKQLQNAQRLLRPLDVLNPFAPGLTFATSRTRNRRDHEKYLTLIDAIALLHQHQRERGRHAVNGRVVEFVEVTIEDIALANKLAPEVLGRSLDDLPPQTRCMCGFIRELLKAKRRSQGTRAASTFSRRELRDACGWSLTQVSVHLERLVALEYLALRHGRLGSTFIYEVRFDPDAPEPAADAGLIDVAELRKSHDYNAEVTGFAPGVPGGAETGSSPLEPLTASALG